MIPNLRELVRTSPIIAPILAYTLTNTLYLRYINLHILLRQYIIKASIVRLLMDGDGLMRNVIVLSGKAKQVFRYLALLAQLKGSTTLKELR